MIAKGDAQSASGVGSHQRGRGQERKGRDARRHEARDVVEPGRRLAEVLVAAAVSDHRVRGIDSAIREGRRQASEAIEEEWRDVRVRQVFGE